MKKGEKKGEKDQLRNEYDFSGGVRGKYAARFAEASNVVVVDPEVARLFGGPDGINRALRSLAELARRQVVPEGK